LEKGIVQQKKKEMKTDFKKKNTIGNTINLGTEPKKENGEKNGRTKYASQIYKVTQDWFTSNFVSCRGVFSFVSLEMGWINEQVGYVQTGRRE